MEQGSAETIIATRALEAIDRFKKGMNVAFQKALGELPLDAPIEIPIGLRRKAGKVLSDMNVKVKGAETREIVPRAGMSELDELDLIEAGKSPTATKAVPTGEGRLIFPDFGDSPGKTTTISSQGGGRAMMQDAFQRLINAPDAVTMEDLMNFRRSIDDALSVTTTEVSGEARVALGRLREIVANELKDVPGYLETMSEYEEASTALFRMESELGLIPGALTSSGEIRGLKTSTVVRKLMSTLSESGPETPFAALQELQEKGGDTSITSALVGAGSKPLAGTGLVVKSELSQAARMAVGMASLGVSAASLWKLPATVMFSPRGINEILLRAMDPQSLGGNIATGINKVGTTAGNIGDKASKAHRAAKGVQQAFQKANKSSGGELAKLAAKEGLTIGQLFERLQINTGVEFEEGDLARKPTFLENVSNIARPAREDQSLNFNRE